MLQKLLLQNQAAQSVIECIKKDVVYMSAAAWDDIPAPTLTRSWNKLLASDKVTESDQQLEDADAHEQSTTNELDHNLSDEDITNWIKEDSSNPGYLLLTDKEIIQQVMNPSAE